jgi:hypothetical protein
MHGKLRHMVVGARRIALLRVFVIEGCSRSMCSKERAVQLLVD